MKTVLLIGVLSFVALEKLAQVLIYLFCVLFFGFGSYVLIRDFMKTREERAQQSHAA